MVIAYIAHTQARLSCSSEQMANNMPNHDSIIVGIPPVPVLSACGWAAGWGTDKKVGCDLPQILEIREKQHLKAQNGCGPHQRAGGGP